MNKSHLMKVNERHLGIICLCVITIILFAGLWPRTFHTGNDVALSPDGKGIRFPGRGIIYTLSSLCQPAEATRGSFTIEMLIQSDTDKRHSMPIILDIDDGKPCERLFIGQWRTYLIISSRQNDSCWEGNSREIGLKDALLKGKSRFITITSDNNGNGTKIYSDGILMKWQKNLSLLDPDEMLSGRLIMGNSSDGKHSWAGTVTRLAIYDQTLSSGEVLRNYEAWQNNGNLFIMKSILPITTDYRFDERNGPIVKDLSGLGNDLIIPKQFMPLKRRMLEPPWRNFHASRSFARDVAINILGFIPFGFFVAWYLSERGANSLRVVIVAMALGIGASLFIEIIQAYIPERSSELMDVLTNSGGTALGIFLWHRYMRPLFHSTIT